MATYTESVVPYEAILSYEDLSFDQVMLTAGAGSLLPGSVLGKVTKRQAAAPIPAIVGTGTGLMSALSCGPYVQVGNYLVTLLATSATAAFSVVAPDGTSLPNGVVGTAYTSSHINFLVSNGGTMTVGDRYTVAVTAGGTPVLVGTGTGTVGSFSLGKEAQLGTYRVQLTSTSATSPFVVTAPDGSILPNGAVATAYTSSHINFTLANGGTMTIGDYFNFVVAGYVAPESELWDPTAVNGLQVATEVLAGAAVGGGLANVVARHAEVKSAMLQWKTTVTAAQKVEAYRQLLTNSVVVRG